MNLNHLEYVAAIARCGSISQASKELFVSQPYLSSMIKSLECELDFQLFERTPNGMTVTPIGHTFLESAHTILREVQVIRALSKTQDQSLLIASYFSPFFMKCFLSFRMQGDGQPFDTLQEMTLSKSLRALAEGEVNLSLICSASAATGKYREAALRAHCVCRALFSNVPLHVVMRPQHPLSGESGVSYKQILAYPLVCFADSRSFLELLHLGTHPNLLLVSDRGSYFDAICNGEYVSVIALLSREGGPVKSELSYVPLTESECTMDFSYVVRKDYRLHPRERAFLGFIRKEGTSPAVIAKESKLY